MAEGGALDSDDTNWVAELETALLEECDFGSLRNICKGRPIPDHLRGEVWQICLNVQGKGDSLASFDELYDMEEQALLRDDCAALVDKLGNEEEDKVSIISDLESIVTFYCKSRGEKYCHGNGWLEVLQPLLTLKLSRSQLYNCFYAIANRYLPRECEKNGRPFHLFRLLVQYHDPELCSFLDTRRITPDTFAQSWFSSLFASTCDLQVILKMWDVYMQHADPFLIFFLALVILINAKDSIMLPDSEEKSKQALIECIQPFPAALEADDIEDFCALAQYYASKTPQSFRRDYQLPLFGHSLLVPKGEEEVLVSQALCLPVSVNELLQANQLGAGDGVRYFVVDCRPAEQYNSGHLPTAFHLDANLMLQNPEEFNAAVGALLRTQKQSIASGSVAGGEHLCFLGSGREEEDQFVNMVVANFLQKSHQYVSIARGGYAELHGVLRDTLGEGLVGHNAKTCIACSPDCASSTSDAENGEDFRAGKLLSKDLFGKLSDAVKSKSAEVKEKLSNYIKNDPAQVSRHASNTDRVSKRYRNTSNVFSIGDDDEGEEGAPMSSDDETREVVSLETWLRKPELVYSCQCQEIKETGYMYPSHLLVTGSHMFVLREIPRGRKGMAHIQARRALGSIVKITSKKKHPELITFKYGSNEEDGVHVTDMDRFVIPNASDATKAIKQQIIKVLDALDS